MNEDDALATITFTVSVDAGDTVALTYAFDAASATEPTFVDNGDGTGQFDWAPVNADVGTYDVTITGTDSAGANVSEVVRIEVLNVDDTPVIDAVADQEVAINVEAEYGTLEVVFNASDEDVDISLDMAIPQCSARFWWRKQCG